MTLKKKILGASSHLHNTFKIFYIWNHLLYEKDLNMVVKEDEVLGIMNYSLYQSLYIKLAILLDKNGKHSIIKLINIMPESNAKVSLLKFWDEKLKEHEDAIDRIKKVRDQYFAHYDDVDFDIVLLNIISHIDIENLLKDMEIAIIDIWLEIYGEAPMKFDRASIEGIAIKTFAPLY